MGALEHLQQAMEDVDKAFTFDVWDDIGPHLTCGEANALARLLSAVGLLDQADLLLAGHARGDDSGDWHYRGDD